MGKNSWNFSPEYYRQVDKPFECIELFKLYDSLLGEAVKHIWRYKDKGTPTLDLQIAVSYLRLSLQGGVQDNPTLQQTDKCMAVANSTNDKNERAIWFSFAFGSYELVISLLENLIKKIEANPEYSNSEATEPVVPLPYEVESSTDTPTDENVIPEIRFERISNSSMPLPTKKHSDDAGFDISSPIPVHLEPGDAANLHLDFKMEIPVGYFGMLIPRSSTGSKGLSLRNTLGIIDSGYRGEVIAKIVNTNTEEALEFAASDRILQLIVVKFASMPATLAPVRMNSDRGQGGFGSTGK